MHPRSVPGHPSLRVPRCARGPWLWSRHPAPPRGTQRVPAPRGEGGEAEQLRNLGQKSVCSQLTPTRVTADGSGEWLRDTPHRAPRLRAPALCSQLLPPAGMGNITCVPQAPGRFRHSFRRKPSLKKEQNGKKKLPSFFGIDGGGERDTTADKILQYIPGKHFQNQENQKENLDQRFPSLFKKGRRKTVVRNLGKIIYYSKVKLKLQHCQEVNDCYLELFQSYLYFQSMGFNGLTYQGLLPLKELNVCEIEAGKSPGQEDHAFRITGPLLNPLIVFCPTESELKQWLYHLEKQIQLNGGSLGLPFLPQDDWQQSSMGKEELRWSVQNMPVQDWRGTQRESLGNVICASKVKLQHLPFQEQHDRLLVLYPSTLVIVSEEHNSFYFKGELPLNAIQVCFEENEKTSFLIEGRLINSIRVICRSYEDYGEWLDCLKTAQFRNADSSLSGSESFSGSKQPHLGQLGGSGRGSLASDGRTNSWASGGKGATLTHLSQNSGSFHDAQSFVLLSEGRMLEDPLSPGYSQPLHCLPHTNWPSTGLPSQELRRGSSARKSKGRSGQDTERTARGLIPEHPDGELVPAAYSEPYSSLSSWHHPTASPSHPELSNVLQCPKTSQPLPSRHWREMPGAQRPPQPPADAPYLAGVSSLPEEHLGPLLQPPGDSSGAYDLPEGFSRRGSAAYHDYAELQSFQSDFSYDNLWEAEGRAPSTPRGSPTPSPHFYQA